MRRVGYGRLAVVSVLWLLRQWSRSARWSPYRSDILKSLRFCELENRSTVSIEDSNTIFGGESPRGPLSCVHIFIPLWLADALQSVGSPRKKFGGRRWRLART
jgi:hypothetical protein